MSWADLDKVQIGKPRDDGTPVVVVRDARTAGAIREAKHLSIIMAISRVVRARDVMEAKLGRLVTVIYACVAPPPDFLADAIAAAGGVVFDGTRELPSKSENATSALLDAAFCDLASAVRRRLGARTFRTALEVRESELARTRPDPADPAAWWTAIIELVALFGEHLRETQPARWIAAPANNRLPLALDLGAKLGQLQPGKLAHTIVEGGNASMTALLLASQAASSTARGTQMALLVARNAVPIEKIVWERLLPAETDTDDIPVIAYVEDHGGAVSYPPGGPPTADLRARAIANLAREPIDLQLVDFNGATVAVVSGGFYAAESLLVPAAMARIRATLGGPRMMLVAVPARGELLAIDGERATIDDDLRASFVMLVLTRYGEATERDRISSAVLVYAEAAIGRIAYSAPAGASA